MSQYLVDRYNYSIAKLAFMKTSTFAGLSSATLAAVMFAGTGLAIWTQLTGFVFFEDPTLLFIALGDLFVFLSFGLFKRPEVFKQYYGLIAAAVIAGSMIAIASGFLYSFELVVPGPWAIVDYGYPLEWRNVSTPICGASCLSVTGGTSYDPVGLVVDALFYSGLSLALGTLLMLSVRRLRLRVSGLSAQVRESSVSS